MTPDEVFARRYFTAAGAVVGTAAVAPSPAAWAIFWGSVGAAQVITWRAREWIKDRALDRELSCPPVAAVRPLPALVVAMADRSVAA